MHIASAVINGRISEDFTPALYIEELAAMLDIPN